jgi:hypothetical protein
VIKVRHSTSPTSPPAPSTSGGKAAAGNGTSQPESPSSEKQAA